MSDTRVLSIVPYKILPAKLGGEKGIALFNEYIANELNLIAVGVKANDISFAKNYSFLNILPDSRSRYGNFFLYFKVRRCLKQNQCRHLIIEHPYFGWLAWLIKITTKVTWIVHSHNIEFNRSKSIGRKWWPALKWYERWVYKKSDINFYISDDDRNYAVEQLGIRSEKCHTITYGIEVDSLPDDIKVCKQKVRDRYQLTNEKILLFNGSLAVISNYEAVDIIIDKINPSLLSAGIPYKIIICGKGLPERFNELKDYKDKNIIYAGFVDDVSEYFKAADIFLNPIISGAGIKTKAVEAIAYDCTVLSTELGALGMIKSVCGNKLAIVADGDWTSFSQLTIQEMKAERHTLPAFYQYYFWGNIARKAADIIKKPLGNSGG